MLWLRRGSENNNLYVMAMVISKWYVFFYVIHTSSIFSIIYFTCMCVTIIVLMHVIHKLILEDVFWHYKLIIYNELKTISPQPIWHLQFNMSISNLCVQDTCMFFYGPWKLQYVEKMIRTTRIVGDLNTRYQVEFGMNYVI